MRPEIEIVPTLSDNYTYIFREPAGNRIAIIDPGEAAPVIRRLKEKKWTPTEIWVTHKHHDHVDGVSELGRHFDIITYAPVEVPESKIVSRAKTIQDGTRFQFGQYQITAREVPGHTQGHLIYMTDDVVFSGDVLFMAGCGRIFEGSPKELYRGISRYLMNLPDSTLFYCGHEYSVKNLKFALSVDPDNDSIVHQLAYIQKQLASGQPSMPGELAREKLYNPFMRVNDDAFVRQFSEREGVSDVSPSGIFTALRALRDVF